MGAKGLRLGAVWVLLAASASAQESVSASVLLTAVQGTGSLRAQHGSRLSAAVRRGLDAHGYHASTSHELVGRALVACQTPECTEQALDEAEAAFAIVPAIWLRKSGGEEVTLTLVQRSGRSLNATGVVGDELAAVTVGLVEGLLGRRVGAGTAAGAGAGTGAGAVTETAAVTATAAVTETAAGAGAVVGTGNGAGGEVGRARGWRAGPVILIGGGAASIVAIGVGAGVKRDDQRFDASAVAAWAAVGAAAIGGGVAWWVVGAKRRRRAGESQSAVAAGLALHPTKIDLRLRF